jgi:DNA-binding response OmpR family regulator
MARILVIDDDPQIRRLVARACSSWNYHVSEAEDGLAATLLMEDESYDLIITDIHMPEMDGIELVTALRDRSANVKILAISGGWSGRAKEEVLLDADLLGADLVLPKPFTLDELRSAVDGLVKGKAQPPGS